MSLSPAYGIDEVLAGVEDGVGRLVLNRPHAINALTLPMVDAVSAQLVAWAEDDGVESVRLTGAGDRGLCAGGDVRAMRESTLAGTGDAAAFLRGEYELVRLLAHYPKRLEAVMTGVTMGGGLGLAAYGSLRMVDETSRIAMPETVIGLYPDAGVLWQLSRAPGGLGTFLALTGATVGGGLAIRAGLADSGMRDEVPPPWVDICFAGDDPAAMIDALATFDDDLARQTVTDLLSRSPLSVCVALEALRRAQGMSTADEVIDQDLVVGPTMVGQPDFVEGVRAQLVDKDRSPRWSYAHVRDVPREHVLAMFGEV